MGPTLYKSILETNGALLRYWRGDILAISSFHLHVTYFIFVVPSCKQSPSDILQGLKHASAAKHFRDRRVKTLALSKVSPSFQHTKIHLRCEQVYLSWNTILSWIYAWCYVLHALYRCFANLLLHKDCSLVKIENTFTGISNAAHIAVVRIFPGSIHAYYRIDHIMECFTV